MLKSRSRIFSATLPTSPPVGMILFLWALSCQPHSVHKPLYPLMIDLVAALYQFLIYSSHTVAAFML